MANQHLLRAVAGDLGQQVLDARVAVAAQQRLAVVRQLLGGQLQVLHRVVTDGAELEG